jgi:hypothetical protein
MNLKKYILVLLLFAIAAPITLKAQRKAIKKPPQNRFGLGLTAGLNTTQINGDFLSGYDKSGIFAGFRALAKLTHSSELVIELQYNRKGVSDPDNFVAGRGGQRSLSLDYIEIPILIHKIVESNSVRYSLEGGISYARLFGVKISENPNTFRYPTFSNIENEFSNQDLALLIGGGVMLGERIRLMTRFSYSLNLLYENENPVVNNPEELPVFNMLRNVQLAFGVNYFL